jgi:hypothetical protein
MEHFIKRNKLQFRVIAAIMLVLVFAGCAQKPHEAKLSMPDSIYMKAGSEITAKTFDSLRNSLLKAISEKGIEEAITFCNLNAALLTQSYADTFFIKRTALHYRNTNNQPDSLELSILEDMTAEMQMKEMLPASRIIKDREGIHYFKPIIMQGMCLSCHGKRGEQISATTVAQINRLYPSDKAVNFREGDLRGMWHIIFKKNSP